MVILMRQSGILQLRKYFLIKPLNLLDGFHYKLCDYKVQLIYCVHTDYLNYYKYMKVSSC